MQIVGYEVITNEEGCDSLCKQLIGESYIAVDTEFFQQNNKFKLSLIQITSSHGNFILDLDFSENKLPMSLHAIFENKNIIKVFHGHQQDVEILNRDFKIKIKSLFDTQIGMMFLHMEATYSYQQLVEEFEKIKIDKTHQMDNWQIRPLTKEQLDYAALDVFYLYKIYPALLKKLEKKKRLQWTNSYMDEIPLYKKDKTITDEYIIRYKVNIPSKLQYYRLECLLNLSAVPESYFKNIIEAKSLTINRISRILKDSKTNFEETIYEKILEVVKFEPEKDVLETIEWHDNKKIELNYEESHIFIILKYLLRNVSFTHKISARLIAEKKDLLDLIYKRKTRLQKGWRFEIFGREALSLLNGELTVTIKDNILVIK